MSWSLPRLYLSPQRDSKSKECSVSRPLQPLGDRAISAVTGAEVAGDAPDGGHADSRLSVDFAVGQRALQQLDHRPAIRHGLQFGRGAQIAEEAAAFIDAGQAQDRRVQRTFVLLLLAQADGPVGLHALLSHCTMY